MFAGAQSEAVDSDIVRGRNIVEIQLIQAATVLQGERLAPGAEADIDLAPVVVQDVKHFDRHPKIARDRDRQLDRDIG